MSYSYLENEIKPNLIITCLALLMITPNFMQDIADVNMLAEEKSKPMTAIWSELLAEDTQTVVGNIALSEFKLFAIRYIILIELPFQFLKVPHAHGPRVHYPHEHWQ